MSVSRAGPSPPVLSLVVLMAAICGVAAGDQAQQAPATPTAPAAGAATPAASPAPPAASPQPLNVMVVDIQTLLRKSKAAGMVRQQLEQKRAEYAKEVSTQNEALRHDSEALQQQASSLSPDALNQKKQEFQQKRSEFDKNVQSKRQALERSEAEASEKIQTVIRDIVTEIATEKNVNLVFQSTQLVILSPSFNVTDTVLQKLDERLPSLTVSVVEQPVANAPAPAPPPAAPPKKKK
jgi:outer membrane protein